MCGLLAMISPERCDLEPISAGLKSLRSRGPDGDGLWLSSDGRVVLGHTRLAVVGSMECSQPVCSEDGRIVAVVTGEFYDEPRARDKLERLGHRFSTDTDSELLVHMYEEYGADCVDRLRGEFAFVLWDNIRETMLIARDRYGVKPLFYAWQGHKLCVSSSVSALKAMGVRLRWSAKSLTTALLSWLPPDGSLFDGVHQLAPGHTLTIDRGRISEKRYWDLALPRRDATKPAEIADIARQLETAVGLRLRANGPIAVLLSGGVDSSLIAALASRYSSSLLAFHFRFQSGFDEHEEAMVVARELGLDLELVDGNATSLSTAFDKAVIAGEGLTHNAHGAARYLVAQAVASAGARVALTGDGADEVFGGYTAFTKDLSPEKGPPPSLLKGVNEFVGFLPSWVNELAISRAPLHLVLTPKLLATSRDVYTRLVRESRLPSDLEALAPAYRSMLLWSRTVLPNYALLSERLDMSVSLESRQPFLDSQVQQTLSSVDPRQLIGNGKSLLRRVARAYIPERIVTRFKHPFAAPPSWLIREPLEGHIRSLAASPVLESIGVVRKGQVAKLERHSARADARTRRCIDSALTLLASLTVLHCELEVAATV